MLNQLEHHIQKAEKFRAVDLEDLEKFRVMYLGKKGILNDFFCSFKTVPNEKKKEFGQQINKLKTLVTDKVNTQKLSFQTPSSSAKYNDVSRPPKTISLGARHPISIVKDRVIDIFSRVAFEVSEGPEIEDDWHNFTALNLPAHHPARDMQDTFFVQTNPDMLLRTHTSSVQIRYMKAYKPPIRRIFPGRVFRNESISARSHCIFHQVEGLYIDKKVSFKDLRETLIYFSKKMFGNSKIRLRPSYFPFTEPSAEVDIYWGLNNEVDYRITKGTGWLEIMGCGMVDPNVLINCGIDPDVYTGYAFGMGIERMAMLLYQVSDIRMFYENDVRFLEEFKTI